MQAAITKHRIHKQLLCLSIFLGLLELLFFFKLNVITSIFFFYCMPLYVRRIHEKTQSH